jgi:hypothetical protein
MCSKSRDPAYANLHIVYNLGNEYGTILTKNGVIYENTTVWSFLLANYKKKGD